MFVKLIHTFYGHILKKKENLISEKYLSRDPLFTYFCVYVPPRQCANAPRAGNVAQSAKAQHICTKKVRHLIKLYIYLI